jgi:hypothetical protein
MLLFKTQRESERGALDECESGEREMGSERETLNAYNTHIHKYVRSITLSCPYTFHGAQKEKLEAAKEAG